MRIGVTLMLKIAIKCTRCKKKLSGMRNDVEQCVYVCVLCIEPCVAVCTCVAHILLYFAASVDYFSLCAF